MVVRYECIIVEMQSFVQKRLTVTTDGSDHVVRLGVISFVFDLKNKANAMLETASPSSTKHNTRGFLPFYIRVMVDCYHLGGGMESIMMVLYCCLCCVLCVCDDVVCRVFLDFGCEFCLTKTRTVLFSHVKKIPIVYYIVSLV